MPTQNYIAKNIAQILATNVNLPLPNTVIAHLATDSRKITFPSESIFFALDGNQNAHQFIPELIKLGVKNFVVSEDIFEPEVNIFKVNNTTEALQQLAAYHRKQFDFPIIGITGSNGKTIVKEWLYQLLSVEKNVIRSPKSYNSQIGVALSVWQLSDQYNLGIFEAGISEPNEMAKLQQIINPNIGILTNIGTAHDEGFESTEQKLNEKLKLFTNADILFYNPKYSISKRIDSLRCKKFTWGESETDLQIISTTKIEEGTEIKLNYSSNTFSIRIPFTDSAAIENSVICCAVLLYFEYSPETIAQRFKQLIPVAMRMDIREGINNCTIINDAYNSDLNALEIALDVLKHQKQHQKTTVILSDIFQSGISSKLLYQKVNNLLINKKIDRLIGIGKDISAHGNLFLLEKQFYLNTQDFLNNINLGDFNNEVILLKGSRKFEFEVIGKRLEQKIHETVFEINLNALINNLNYYKTILKPKTKLMAMVKAFSYGSGSFEIANILQFYRVNYLAVAYVDEGTELRMNGVTLPIMVMSPDVSSFEMLLSNCLEPEIYNFRILKSFIDFIRHKKVENYPIHLKIDTGMHRLGFEKNELHDLIDLLNTNNKCIQIKSVFTHLVSSEDPQNDDFTKHQLEVFDSICKTLEVETKQKFLRHSLNTAGISRFPNAQSDMVRLGIGLYGIPTTAKDAKHLQPIGTLRTTITQIKDVEAGDSIGYGRKATLSRKSRIATVKIGYADGLSRALSNGVGSLLVNGKLAPIVGNVCMDMTMLDVTDIACNEGDDVIVFNDVLKVETIAQQLNTNAYEILTNVSQRVKRIYYYD